MNTMEEAIYDQYVEKYFLTKASYDVMGKLLDRELLYKNLERFGMRELYIYGAGFLGIQLYDAAKSYVNSITFIDKNENLIVERTGAKVCSLEYFRKNYTGQYVIVTPLPYYREIESELVDFMDKEHIVVITELTER